MNENEIRREIGKVLSKYKTRVHGGNADSQNLKIANECVNQILEITGCGLVKEIKPK